MKRAAARGREQRRSELADLVVSEAVVRGRTCRVFGEETGSNGWQQRVREDRRAAAFLVCPEMQLDRPEISEAEAPAEDRRVGQVLLRVGGQPRGAALDQRAHRGRQQPVGVSRERPRSVDLLDQSSVAVRPGQLLDDERDALGLRVHRRAARWVDLASEDLLDELGAFQLREPFEPEAADHPHSLHVGDEGHGFADRGQLLRTCGECEKDR
jgi:hypothetical protein